jgi:hypothetical protein
MRKMRKKVRRHLATLLRHSTDIHLTVAANKEGIEDRTETNLVNLRRTIYLSIMNALNYEEAVHKLLKVQLQEGQEVTVFLQSPRSQLT